MLSFSATVGDQGRVRAVTTPSPSPSLLPGGQGRVPGQLQDDQAPGYVRDQCRHAKVEQAAAHARVRGTRLPPSTNLFLTTGYWLLTADYYWLLATCSLLLATCCLLLATCYLLLATCYLLLTTCYSLLTTYYLRIFFSISARSLEPGQFAHAAQLLTSFGMTYI